MKRISSKCSPSFWQYIWRSDVTESMVTIRSPFCGRNNSYRFSMKLGRNKVAHTTHASY